MNIDNPTLRYIYIFKSTNAFTILRNEKAQPDVLPQVNRKYRIKE